MARARRQLQKIPVFADKNYTYSPSISTTTGDADPKDGARV